MSIVKALHESSLIVGL